jgi:hypothetical protein
MQNLELIRQRFPQQYDQLTRFGGDLLSNPSRPANAIDGSPWSVGATAAASRNGSAAGAGAGSPYGPAEGAYPKRFIAGMNDQNVAGRPLEWVNPQFWDQFARATPAKTAAPEPAKVNYSSSGKWW